MLRTLGVCGRAMSFEVSELTWQTGSLSRRVSSFPEMSSMRCEITPRRRMYRSGDTPSAYKGHSYLKSRCRKVEVCCIVVANNLWIVTGTNPLRLQGDVFKMYCLPLVELTSRVSKMKLRHSPLWYVMCFCNLLADFLNNLFTTMHVGVIYGKNNALKCHASAASHLGCKAGNGSKNKKR